ncbi:MAG: hypothetical protein WD377_07905 [Nitriliruptoraceae bacterium]
MAVGRSAWLAGLTGPLFQFLRMICPLAWTPVAIVLVIGVLGHLLDAAAQRLARASRRRARPAAACGPDAELADVRM